MPRLRFFSSECFEKVPTLRCQSGYGVADQREIEITRHPRDRQLRRELLEITESELDLELAMRRAAGEPIRTTAKDLGIDASTVSRRGTRALRFIQSAIVAKVTCTSLRRQGGATLPLNLRIVPSDLNAFAVSLAGYNRPFEGLPSWQQVAAWIRKNWSTLLLPDESIDDELRIRYIGAWHESGHSELDITVIIREEAMARRIAYDNGQRAIYHFASRRAIYVS